MFFHEERYEMSAANDEISSNPTSSDDNPKSHSGEDSNTSSADSGVQRYKAGTITFGLLALLQLSLIIYLAYHIEANKNVNEERDDLKRALNNFTLQLNSLKEERDKLEMMNFNMEVSGKNLTEERDDLKGKLNDLVSKKDSLTEERDNLTRINSDTEARSRTISLERDELRKRFNTLDSQHRSVTEERDRMKSKLNIIAQPGWSLLRGTAYYISSAKKTWQDSRTYCHSVGADLMIINSKEEQDFANSFQRYMWIGLTDSEIEGTWKWVDGSPLTTSYWGDKEPNGDTGENCGDIKTFTTERSWNDETCSVSLNWICELRLI